MPIRRASDAVPRPAPPERRRRPPLPGIGRVAIGLFLTAVVVVSLWLRPWLVGPPVPIDQVDAIWAEAVASSAPDPGSGGDPDLLKEAVAALEPARGLLETAWDEPESEGLLDPLPGEIARSADLLVAWSEQGGLGADPCVQWLLERSPSAVDLLFLGRAAMAAAAGPDDPRWAATLHLGSQLRGRGGALPSAVGLALASEALDRAQERAFPPHALRIHRPTAAEIYPSLAREAVCTYAEVEAALTGDLDLLEIPEFGRGALASKRRELAMLRWWHGERLARAREARSDLAALGGAVAVPNWDDLPRSSALRLTVPGGQSAFVERAADTVGRYDAFLADR